MEELIGGSICVVSCIILYQDFKDRLISTFLFPLMLVLTFVYRQLIIDMNNIIWNLSINAILILILVLGIWVVNRYRKKDRLLDSFGLGDIFILIAISPLIAYENFMIFIMMCAVLGILYYLVKTISNPQRQATVPFAGIVSGLVSIALFLELFDLFSVYNPWIYHLSDFSTV
ncbi:MAG: prepilin peptidase [Flavobacteriales bacterium]|nr:prepilin peptidase [Flavobacteriales bacterium]